MQCIDIDKNQYKTVKIGKQIWMAENLKVTRYRDGDTILTGYMGGGEHYGEFYASAYKTYLTNWSNLSKGGGLGYGAYAIYEDNKFFQKTFGNLYNWYAVNDKRGLAPKGWHIPSDDEWNILLNYCKGDTGKLREKGRFWNNDFAQTTLDAIHSKAVYNSFTKEEKIRNTEPYSNVQYTGLASATNKYGLSILPGGEINHKGFFFELGRIANFWTSTESKSYKGKAYRRSLGFSSSDMYGAKVNNPDVLPALYAIEKTYGFSIRCIAD